MTELAKQFQSNLNKIFGDKHVKVRIIHDDRDICINSSEREILYAIQEQQQSIHNLHWSFSERFLTKALTISFKKNPIPHFQGIAEIYKKYFDEINQKKTNNCQNIAFTHEIYVSEILHKLNDFHDSYKNNKTPILKNNFDKNLHFTFMAYINKIK